MKDWWRGSVTYQVYPRSFQDSNADGIGDLPGITRRLAHIAQLGCDAVLMNTAIAGAQDPIRMSPAMKHAVIAGREAYLAGRMPRRMYADPSSPLSGLI
jgi:thiazole synthase